MRKDFGSNPWFYPLPVLIVGTYDAQGRPDAMNAAWGGLYDANLVELCLSSGHKTYKNIQEKKAFTRQLRRCRQRGRLRLRGPGLRQQHPGQDGKSRPHRRKKRRGGRAPLSGAAPDPGVPLRPHHRGRQRHRRDRQHQRRRAHPGRRREHLHGKVPPIAFEPVHNGYHVLGEKVGDAFKAGNALE